MCLEGLSKLLFSEVTSFDRHLLLLIKDQCDLEEIISIVKKGRLCKIRDSKGNTLLHYAVKYDNFELVEYLIDSGSNVDAQNALEQTPLMLAILSDLLDREKIVKVLINAGASLFECEESGKSILQIIGESDTLSKDTFRLILKRLQLDRDFNQEKIAKELFDAKWPLAKIVQLGDTELTEIALKRECYRFNIDEAKNDYNQTALHVAVENVDNENVKLLLEYQADVHFIDSRGRTPLSYVLTDDSAVCPSEKLYIFDKLLERTITRCVYSEGIQNILIHGNKQLIKLSLEKYFSPMCIVDSDHNTVVHYLAQNKNLGIIELLRNENFNVNARNCRGKTALMYAAENGNVHFVEFLLSKEADVNVGDNRDRTALFYAIIKSDSKEEKSSKQIVQMLLEHDADVQVEVEDFSVPSIFHAILIVKKFALGKLVIAHLALEETRGTFITTYIKGIVISRALLKIYFDWCKQQLLVEIHQSITLFDLLTVTDMKMEYCLRNEEVAEKLDDFCSNLNNLDYFSTILEKRLAKAKEMIRLRKKVGQIICRIMQTNYDGFFLVADNITSYLELQDWKNLIDALSEEYSVK